MIVYLKVKQKRLSCVYEEPEKAVRNKEASINYKKTKLSEVVECLNTTPK